MTPPLALPDGTSVRARGLRASEPDSPEYGLYLGGNKLRGRFDVRLTWPHEWIAWPDFWLPKDSVEATRLIRDLLERAQAGRPVEVACGGGIGRTGTVVACLAILTGIDPAQAVAWAREHHHPRAVETPWQARWVRQFPYG
ncbi:protein-tyrosine phosphatase family protein [Actinokineospora enzanensis]|uniref:protein-tyrosine phosphatase family protein n=1 Tax=Actinokineospora enzanensis TaxID=155975 RepID=UPI00047683A8|nr:protein-tyrosine phosphatase family protein [Actinokineospora enzanensis]